MKRKKEEKVCKYCNKKYFVNPESLSIFSHKRGFCCEGHLLDYLLKKVG